ncbi:MAG: hypothetical protein ACRDSN_16890, partial [Pseudonocardiaceae bacterium]
SRASAYKLADSGELPSRRLGGRIYIVHGRSSRPGEGSMRGHVFRRGSCWYYKFRGPADQLTRPS